MTYINEISEALPHRRSIKKVKTYSEGKKQFAICCKKANLVPETIDRNTISAVVKGNGVIVAYFRERQPLAHSKSKY